MCRAQINISSSLAVNQQNRYLKTAHMLTSSNTLPNHTMTRTGQRVWFWALLQMSGKLFSDFHRGCKHLTPLFPLTQPCQNQESTAPLAIGSLQHRFAIDTTYLLIRCCAYDERILPNPYTVSDSLRIPRPVDASYLCIAIRPRF